MRPSPMPKSASKWATISGSTSWAMRSGPNGPKQIYRRDAEGAEKTTPCGVSPNNHVLRLLCASALKKMIKDPDSPARLELVQQVGSGRFSLLRLEGPLARERVAQAERADRVEETDAVAHIQAGGEIFPGDERGLLEIALGLDLGLIQPDTLPDRTRQQVSAPKAHARGRFRR